MPASQELADQKDTEFTQVKNRSNQQIKFVILIIKVQ